MNVKSAVYGDGLLLRRTAQDAMQYYYGLNTQNGPKLQPEECKPYPADQIMVAARLRLKFAQQMPKHALDLVHIHWEGDQMTIAMLKV
jgi:hypothetical protein